MSNIKIIKNKTLEKNISELYMRFITLGNLLITPNINKDFSPDSMTGSSIDLMWFSPCR